MINDVLPSFGDKFVLKKSLANLPLGMLKTIKFGFHAVTTLLINDEIVFRSVPSKMELVNKLKEY